MAFSRQPPLALLSRLAVPVCLGVILTAVTRNVADPDLFGHLAFGRLFFESPGFPYHDVFSYYPVKPVWIYHEWLSGVIFYILYSAWGAAALQTGKYLLIAGTLFLTWKTARKNGASSTAWAVCVLMGAGVFALGCNPVRAQMFTYFFFSLTLYLLERARRENSPNRLWLLVPVFWAWSNLHGGFLAGLGLVALHGLGCLWQARAGDARSSLPALAGVPAMCLLVSLINPYGFSYWTFLVRAAFMPRPFIVEWWPLHKTIQYGFYLPASLLFLLMAGAAAAGSPRLRAQNPAAILVLAATGLMGCLHHRHVVFFAVCFFALMPPIIAGVLEKSAGKGGRASRILLMAFASLAVAGNLAMVGFVAPIAFSGSPLALRTPSPDQAPPGSPDYPAGAVNYIREKGLRGNVLTEFHWGEYVLWRLHPQCRVALDGRYETVYPEEIFPEHFLAFENPRASPEQVFAYLDKRPTEMVIASAGSRVAGLLERDIGWRKEYEDKGCALFMRNPL